MLARVNNAAKETFRSLEIRNFRLFFGGQVISQIGNWMTLVTQTLLVLSLTNNSGVAVGVLAACQFGPVLLLGAWAGLVADRSDKRKLLTIVQTIAMIQSFVLAALAFSGHAPLLAIYGIALVGGFTIAFDNPVRRSFVNEMVPEHHVQNAVALNSALMTGSRIVGPAVAGVLVVSFGYGWAFLLDGLSYIAVIAGLLAMHTSQLYPSAATAKGKGQVREGLRYVKTVPDLWVPMVMTLLIGALALNSPVVVPLFVYDSFGGSSTDFTILLSVISVGSLIGALSVAGRRSLTMRYVVIAAVVFGVSMTLMAGAPTLVIAFPLGVFMGAATMAYIASSNAVIQLRADPLMRGRVVALQTIVLTGTTPIGAPIIGWVCDAFNPRVALLIGAASCFVAAGIGFFAIRGRPVSTPAPIAIDGSELVD